MEKEFIPFELAVKLKEFGFDESCFGSYYNNSEENFKEGKFDYRGELNIEYSTYNENTYYILAPTYSQTFRWFRENYDMIHNIDRIFKDEFGYTITPGDNEPINGFCFNSYEEAELACIEKLIEIVESNLNK
jgi:hypothetical protein